MLSWTPEKIYIKKDWTLFSKKDINKRFDSLKNMYFEKINSFKEMRFAPKLTRLDIEEAKNMPNDDKIDGS